MYQVKLLNFYVVEVEGLVCVLYTEGVLAGSEVFNYDLAVYNAVCLNVLGTCSVLYAVGGLEGTFSVSDHHKAGLEVADSNCITVLCAGGFLLYYVEVLNVLVTGCVLYDYGDLAVFTVLDHVLLCILDRCLVVEATEEGSLLDLAYVSVVTVCTSDDLNTGDVADGKLETVPREGRNIYCKCDVKSLYGTVVVTD